MEAQACYSLGNTYTLLRDYPTAIEYHLRHLIIAQQLMDRVGEGRACWSLGNAHSAMGNHDKALYFATKHLEISKEVGLLLFFFFSFFLLFQFKRESLLVRPNFISGAQFHSEMVSTNLIKHRLAILCVFKKCFFSRLFF